MKDTTVKIQACLPVMDELTKSVLDEASWCMMYADDVVLVCDNTNMLNGELECRNEVLWRKTN